MRNYWLSISLHIAVILLLLYPFLNSKNEKQELEQIVFIDFSQDVANDQKDAIKSTSLKPPKPKKKTTKSNPVVVTSVAAIPEKKPVSKDQDLPVKTEEVSLLQREKEKREQQEALEEIQRKERLEKEQNELEKTKKIAEFTTLFETVDDSDDGTEITGKDHTEVIASPSSKNSNISGTLGNRKVLRKPVIVDKSQKYGRVVVKICVNGQGIVVSSNFTQIGSTTSDHYLIKLAEKGASDYLFSTSPNPRECGKVIIDFELK